MNQKFIPHGLVSGVPKSSGGCARAALLDMAIATAHVAVSTFHRLNMDPSRGEHVAPRARTHARLLLGGTLPQPDDGRVSRA